jgi:RNA recognition motif-containing protein
VSPSFLPLLLSFVFRLRHDTRTGTDSRFAFLDFLSPAQATAALLNRGNKYYTNRKLILQVSSSSPPSSLHSSHPFSFSSYRRSVPIVAPFLSLRSRTDPQYASEGATKRSGTGRALGLPGSGGEKRFDDARPPRPARTFNKAEGVDGGEDGEHKDTRGKKWEASGRTAPGAALAAAKREKVGIVEGTGSKITFD